MHPSLIEGVRGTAAGYPRWCCGAVADGVTDAAHGERSYRGTSEARAGVTGHNVRYVLLIGTLAVIVLFAIAYVVTKV